MTTLLQTRIQSNALPAHKRRWRKPARRPKF